MATPRSLALGVGLVLGLAIGACSTSTDVSCTRASECGAQSVCIDGLCTTPTSCTSSRMCPNLVCDTVQGVCVECVTSVDCDPSLACIENVCRVPTPEADAGMDGGHETDAFAPTGDARLDTDVPADVGEDALVDQDALAPPDAVVASDAFVATDATGCDLGLRYCGGECVDVTSDPMNCSNCGIACGAGYACVDSGCLCIMRCNGVCADLDSDAMNCGACNHACRAGDFCRGGRCFTPPCPTGSSFCTAGGCVDLDTDVSNCGSCGHACPIDQPYCVAGACTSACAPPLSWGFGAPGCRDLGSDPRACGDFTTWCNPEQVCDPSGGPGRGVCRATCSSGLTRCERSCVDTHLDTLNCGACGHACASGEYCVESVCAHAQPD